MSGWRQPFDRVQDDSPTCPAAPAPLTAITDALKRGDAVRLKGFGTFTAATRAAKQARNPRTGEPVTVAASRQPKFKAGKALKDALN